MEIEKIETVERLFDFRSEWERLLEESKLNNIFLTFEWMSLWCKYLCKKSKPLILVFKEDGRNLGIAPLMVSRFKRFHLPIRKIEFLSSDDADRLDFIIPEKKKEIIEKLFNFFLKRYTGWDILEFNDIPDSSNTIEILENLANLSQLSLEKKIYKTFYLHSEEKGKFPNIPSLKGLKRGFHLKRNRLLRFGYEARFERITELERLKGLFPIIVDIENRSWKGSSGKGIFSDRDRMIFHRELIEALAKKNKVEVDIIKFDKEIVSYAYNFIFNSTLFGYNTAYLPEYSYFSPGSFLVYLLFESFFLNEGKEIDFLKGDLPWKHRWSNLYRKQYKIRIFNKTTFSKLLYLGKRIKRIKDVFK